MAEMGHQLPRRSLVGAAARPSKADTKADDWRGRKGPFPDVVLGQSVANLMATQDFTAGTAIEFYSGREPINLDYREIGFRMADRADRMGKRDRA